MGGLLFHIIIPSFALLFGFHAHKQIIFLQYKRSSLIVKNDGDSQEHMLQNTLILRGQEAVRIMLKGFLCLTQPAFTRLPWRITPCPCVHAWASLAVFIILTASKPCEIRIAKSRSAGYRKFLTLWCNLVHMQYIWKSEYAGTWPAHSGISVIVY